MAPFVDLNVLNTTEKKRLQSIIETAARLGYSTIAINHVADLQQKRREIDKPISVKELFTSLPIVQGTSKPIKIVTRLTVIVSEAAHCNDLRTTSKHARLYDIMAVLPKTEKLFHIASMTLDIDLICIHVTEKQPYHFKRPSINAIIDKCHQKVSWMEKLQEIPLEGAIGAENTAIDRGIYFELAYSPAIKDSTMRRYTISNALSLMQICKGKNVIMSSAAERPMELRGPYDLANLSGLLLGLSEGDAKAAVSTNCRAALLHGETRKTALGVIYTMQKAQTNEDQEEGRPLCKRAKTQDD